MANKFLIKNAAGDYEEVLADAQATSKTCLASVSIGDIVKDSSTLVDGVDTVTDNTDVKPAIGIVLDKPTTTSCTVLTYGEYDIGSGLTDSRKVFLSVSGSVTSTPPTTGYLQCLGVAVSATRISFNPHFTRVKRN